MKRFLSVTWLLVAQSLFVQTSAWAYEKYVYVNATDSGTDARKIISVCVRESSALFDRCEVVGNNNGYSRPELELRNTCLKNAEDRIRSNGNTGLVGGIVAGPVIAGLIMDRVLVRHGYRGLNRLKEIGAGFKEIYRSPMLQVGVGFGSMVSGLAGLIVGAGGTYLVAEQPDGTLEAFAFGQKVRDVSFKTLKSRVEETLASVGKACPVPIATQAQANDAQIKDLKELVREAQPGSGVEVGTIAHGGAEIARP